MDPTKGDAKSEEEEEEEEHMRKPLSEKELKANERKTRKASISFSPNSTSSDDDDDGDSPEDLFQLDINKSPAASGQELRRLQSGAQTNPFSSLIDEDVVTTPDRPRRETDVPDPDRIPPSIFTGTSSNSPTQWSAASNESLFSIQGGNSSFSKDHASLSGRSGGQSPGPPSPQPPPSLGSNATTVEARREELEEAADAKAIKDAVLQEHSEGQRQSEEQRRRSSDSSAKSFQSFAFPILTGEGRNSSAKAESAHLLRPANKPQQQPQPETHQLPKSSSAASPPAVAVAVAVAAASPPPPKSKWLACCRCPSFC